MSKQFNATLGSLVATGVGAAANVENLDPLMMQVGGTFVGTYTMEGSTDGTTFAALTDIYGTTLAGLTAARSAQVAGGLKQVRINVTAYTSGTIEGSMGGIDKTLKS